MNTATLSIEVKMDSDEYAIGGQTLAKVALNGEVDVNVARAIAGVAVKAFTEGYIAAIADDLKAADEAQAEVEA